MSAKIDPADMRFPSGENTLSRSHLRQAPSWSEFMREIEPEWQRYMREHDSPEERLRSKNPERFTLPYDTTTARP